MIFLRQTIKYLFTRKPSSFIFNAGYSPRNPDLHEQPAFNADDFSKHNYSNIFIKFGRPNYSEDFK